jgi:hypothetical protein
MKIRFWQKSGLTQNVRMELVGQTVSSLTFEHQPENSDWAVTLASTVCNRRLILVGFATTFGTPPNDDPHLFFPTTSSQHKPP